MEATKNRPCQDSGKVAGLAARLGIATFCRRENLVRFEKGCGKMVTLPKIEAESQERRYRYRGRNRSRLCQSVKADSDCDCDCDPDTDTDTDTNDLIPEGG